MPDYPFYFSNAGTPAVGLAPTVISFYNLRSLAPIAGAPALDEVGGGLYRFVYTPTVDIVMVVDGGAALVAVDRYIARHIGPQFTLKGAGAEAVTVILRDAAGNPIADADVWITSDAGGAIIVAGTLQTNAAGEALFYLDAGETYYRWAQKDGINFTNPQEFVAVAD